MPNKTLVVACVLTMLSLAAPALAGPPFICHPFEIGDAASLPWVDGDYLGTRGDYDITHVVADTQKLLSADMPTVARMETLRRAVLYASRDRGIAKELLVALRQRVNATAGDNRGEALALFDAGYALEAMNEIERMADYMNELSSRGRGLAGLTRPDEGRALMLTSASLRTDDAGIAFALALISKREDRQPFLLKARGAAKQDRLLATNMARLDML